MTLRCVCRALRRPPALPSSDWKRICDSPPNGCEGFVFKAETSRFEGVHVKVLGVTPSPPDHKLERKGRRHLLESSRSLQLEVQLRISAFNHR